MDQLSSVFPVSPQGWKDALDSALEHASFTSKYLQDADLLHARDESAWPPGSTDAPGSIGYHFAAMLDYIYDAFQGLSLVVPDDNAQD